jgi:hypothetical protein
LIDNEKQRRQYNNQQGRGKKPARIGQVQIQVVNGREYQGVKRHRHGVENDYDLTAIYFRLVLQPISVYWCCRAGLQPNLLDKGLTRRYIAIYTAQKTERFLTTAINSLSSNKNFDR